MQPHEIGILVGAVGLLLGGLIWIVVGAFQWAWPKGKRITRKRGTRTIHVVFSDGQVDSAFADAAAKAVWASAEGWEGARREGLVHKDTSEIKESVVLLASLEHMDAMAKALGFKTVAGYIDRIGAKRLGGVFRGSLPVAVISPRNVAEVGSTGEPVIHEMLHALSRDYSGDAMDHTNPNIWKGAKGATKPVQTRAQQLFRTAV